MVPPERRAELYYLLASCTYDQKKYIQAIKYCKMADKNTSFDDKKVFLLAKIYDVWGCSLVDLGKRKEALAIRKKCIEFAKKRRTLRFIHWSSYVLCWYKLCGA
jgi:tetratricopeptide (TPR) repeat protein